MTPLFSAIAPLVVGEGQTRTSAAHLFPVLLLAGLLLSPTGCGRRALIPEETPVMQEPGLYEIFWVEPQIVVADSLITLIRSERIDSARVDPSELIANRPAAVDLRIQRQTCNVSIGLYDSDLHLLRPLLLKDLPPGYYRLTLQVDRFREPSLPPGTYFIKANYCGRTEMAMFSAP